jgi:VIT1/CCC1 family predicted Fe2+/Mn2+ transporter
MSSPQGHGEPAGQASNAVGADHSHENEHADDPQSGILRASVFGVSDGLVSNLALVMGVAGGSRDPDIVVLAGIAGLLAGAFSMAAGEYISMQTQREMLERELAIEREHIEMFPEQEQAHLAELLTRHGLEPEDALRVAAQVHRDTDPAVDFHAQFELGIHPSSLGAPRSAALFSFVSFLLGASVPLLPWLMTADAIVPTVALSALALTGVGAVATRVTHRSVWYGAARQLLVGAVSAAITFSVGLLVATQIQ